MSVSQRIFCAGKENKSDGRTVLCLALLPDCGWYPSKQSVLWVLMASLVLSPLFPKLTAELLKADIFRLQRKLHLGKDW